MRLRRKLWTQRFAMIVKGGRLLHFRRETGSMRCEDLRSIVERQFVRGATVDEPRVVMEDLRALSRQSLLADFAEGRIRAIVAGGSRPDGRSQFPPTDLCRGDRRGATGRQSHANTRLH
ncbi:hypothetical protein DC522_23640 [Microvirga sp. KLBC 81]|nr:hypothetical protein DC522_23640 [Microvirga sp. KLBC 81]